MADFFRDELHPYILKRLCKKWVAVDIQSRHPKRAVS